jgi:hypothetical protein
MGIVSEPLSFTLFDRAEEVVLPAFSAGALMLSPGTDKTNVYVINEGRTEPADSTITLVTTESPRNGFYAVSCYALALGHTVSVANDGPAKGSLGTFTATLEKPLQVVAYFDGTNYIPQGYVWLKPR